MATRNFGKKLALKKETVVNLERIDMNDAKGGFDPHPRTETGGDIDPFGTISSCETHQQSQCNGTSYVFYC